MSPKLFVIFLVLGVLALSVQAGGKKRNSHESKEHSHESKEKSNESKSDHSKSKDSKSEESKEHSKSKESKSEESKEKSKSEESKSNEKSDEDCNEPPKPPKKCGPNEEWTDCGTACPLTCAKPKPGPCILKCVVGCQCKKGLLRNKWGKCVEPCDC